MWFGMFIANRIAPPSQIAMSKMERLAAVFYEWASLQHDYGPEYVRDAWQKLQVDLDDDPHMIDEFIYFFENALAQLQPPQSGPDSVAN